MFNKKKLRMKAMDKMHNEPGLSMTDLMNKKEKLTSEISKENPVMSEKEKRIKATERLKELFKNELNSQGEPMVDVKDYEDGDGKDKENEKEDMQEEGHGHGMLEDDGEEKGLISVTVSPEEHQMIIEMRKNKKA